MTPSSSAPARTGWPRPSRWPAAGRSVLVVEGKETIGGGMRTAELTLPGFIHDVCSAIHPLGVASPFFRSLPLAEHGLEWIFPPAALAHPLDDGTAVVLERSVAATAAQAGPRRGGLPPADSARWWPIGATCSADMLGPLRFPRHPLALARFGAVRPAGRRPFWPGCVFRGERARAVFAGWPPTRCCRWTGRRRPPSASCSGCRRARRRLADGARRLAAHRRCAGRATSARSAARSSPAVRVAVARRAAARPRHPLRRDARASCCSIAGDRLPAGYRRSSGRYRYGPGVFKMDWALDGPIPWKAAGCCRAATVHLGGTLDEIAASERAVWHGEHPERPYVILVQQSLFDPSRAPAGQAHRLGLLPRAQRLDGRHDRRASRRRSSASRPASATASWRGHAHAAGRDGAYNPNYIGGDINGGVQDLRQLFTRPVAA